MLSLILVLAAAAPPAAVAPAVQARASVRLERGAALRFAQIEREQPTRLRATRIKASDGSPQPARLVEFQ
jgi:hypothetical protein